MRDTSKAPFATTGATRARRTMFGLACGAAEHFPGQGFLPDNRAWEMVSPPEKNGGDVAVVTSGTRAAADGEAIAFHSLGTYQGRGRHDLSN